MTSRLRFYDIEVWSLEVNEASPNLQMTVCKCLQGSAKVLRLVSPMPNWDRGVEHMSQALRKRDIYDLCLQLFAKTSPEVGIEMKRMTVKGLPEEQHIVACNLT